MNAEVGPWRRAATAGRSDIGVGVRASTVYAFDPLAAVRVELITDEDNAASQRVAKRCGLVPEGVLRHARRSPDGSLGNACVCARLPAV